MKTAPIKKRPSNYIITATLRCTKPWHLTSTRCKVRSRSSTFLRKEYLKTATTTANPPPSFSWVDMASCVRVAPEDLHCTKYKIEMPASTHHLLVLVGTINILFLTSSVLWAPCTMELCCVLETLPNRSKTTCRFRIRSLVSHDEETHTWVTSFL